MLSLQITDDVSVAFGTPVLRRQLPECDVPNAQLATRIREVRESSGGVSISNRGGWQSEPDLWRWQGYAFDWFRTAVDDAVRRIAALPGQVTDVAAVSVRYDATAWANVNSRGDYNARHIHPGVHWSIVYYVDAGGAADPGHEDSGQLELYDPRPLAQTARQPDYGFGRGLAITPSPGVMVAFPAWMEHVVHPFFGAGERISIAVNIRLTGGRHAHLA